MELIRLEYKNDGIARKNTEVPHKDIIDVHNECFENEHKDEELFHYLSKKTAIFVLYEEDVPIGMFFIERLTRDIAYMMSFCIILSHRRKGIGSKLFTYLRMMGERLEVERIVFDSFKDLEDNTVFYAKQGCKILDDTLTRVILWSTETLPDNEWRFQKCCEQIFSGLKNKKTEVENGVDDSTKEKTGAEEGPEISEEK